MNNIEIITIGSELLSGLYADQNASFLSAKLALAGWKVSRHTTLPDDPQILRKGLEEALKRSKLVIATGGLGATHDDHTKHIATDLLGGELFVDEELLAELHARYGTEIPTLKEMARVPTTAQTLPNAAGAAPGLVFKTAQGLLILLPGVPHEMQVICEQQLLPYLAKHLPGQEKLHVELVHFCLLEEGKVDKVVRELKILSPHIQIGLYPSYGKLTVSCSERDPNACREFALKLKEHFKTHILPESSVEKSIQSRMIMAKKTLALAESCTGGRIASQLTAVPGASEYFLGSLVTYANQLKNSLLHVPESLLNKHGAVSAEAVEAMLAGLFKSTHADYGIAVSGIAGPTGGTPDKPVGTIWAAIGQRGESPHIMHLQRKGTRETIILFTSGHLLATFWQKFLFQIDKKA